MPGTFLCSYSPAHRLHAPLRELEAGQLQEPFEHPGRAETIRAALVADPRFEFVAPNSYGTGPIEAVHEAGLVRFLGSAWADYQVEHGDTHDVVADVFAHPGLRAGMGPGVEPVAIGARLGYWCYETTTPITEGTFAAATASVDVALTAADLVLDGARAAYGLCRPPGHHAATATFGGYCFFNNAAVAAAHVRTRTGAKVAVLDVDYHHGNGTQQIFYGRDDVTFVSLHADPSVAYPYHTGFADEVGSGPGRGANHNVALPVGTDDDHFVAALSAACERLAGADVVIVSLGLDTFGGDPISQFDLTADGLARCGAIVGQLGVPVVVLQEGGYATAELGENARRWLGALHDAITAT